MTVLAVEGQFARLSALVKMSDTPFKFEFHSATGIANESGTPTYNLGTVLGTYLASPTATAGTTVGTGNGVMGAITATPATGLKTGVYTLRITKAVTNAGDFIVEDPQGKVVGVGHVATPYSQAGLAFTLADGSADFVEGDTIPITVAGTLKYKTAVATATDGSQVPSAVYIGNNFGQIVPTTLVASTDTTVLVLNQGKVMISQDALQLDASFNTTALKNGAYAALNALGLLVQASN